VFVTATPTITPGFGTFTGPKAGTVTDTTAGATIYYTTDGTPPTTSLPPCASPCSLVASSTETLKAIAAGGNYGASSVATASLVNQIKQSNITNNSVEAGTYSSFGVVFSATVPTVVPSGAVNSSLRFLASLARLSHVTRARWASRGG
jgi:hypothetical protein